MTSIDGISAPGRSISAAERRNPPPRQKACAACTKAKRRCDFASPACARCSMRCIPCEYPSRTVGAALGQRRFRVNASKNQGYNVSQLQPADHDMVNNDLPLTLQGSNVLSEMLPDPVPTPPPSHESTSPDSSLDGLLGYTGPTLGPDVESPFPADLLSDNTVSALRALQFSDQLTVPQSRTFEAMSEIIAKHLQFSIQVFTQAPASIVQTLSTPWSHHNLYQERMPKSIRDAQAACALYMAKTPINAPIIMRSIDSYCTELLSSPTPTTAFDALAYAQALLLYQIIRLFDGDIRARSSAERSITALETAAISLLPHVPFDEPLLPAPTLPLTPLGPTKMFWKQWLFHESARRTMLFIFFFLQAYRMVSGGKILPCDGKLWLVHSWTMSAHLWKAKTPVEFAQAWKNRNHFVVTNAMFNAVLAEAKADDVDLFGKMLISALMGQDEADAWLTERGGSLHEGVCV